MLDILKSYLKRLTNLSSKNRSLLLLRLISDQTIDMHDFDYILNKSSFSLIEDLIAKKSKIPLAAISDPRMEANNILSQKLKKLQRIEKFIFEERGAKDLYVGWPFIRGKLHGGTTVRCPLIFFPVEIVQHKDQWVLQLREEVNITFNKTFLLAYAFYHSVKISDELLEKVFEIYDKDSRVFRTELYQIFKESPVELNFNQDNFIDQLQSFKNFKKSEFEEETKEGELKLYPEAVLGIFPQSGSYLVPDYTYLLEQEDKIKDIEEFFTSRSPDYNKDNYKGLYHNFIDKIKEEETFTAFPLDAHQENAVKAVKKGNSIVVQGPPGSGKSQLISNLVTDFTARGKKVLVVSQKRAALDVIYKRLKEIEMDKFAALVHDFKNDRKKIYQQIDAQINKIEEYQSMNNGLDSIQLERRFVQLSRKIDQIVEDREEFRNAFFDEYECGVSAKELYLNSDPEKAHINLKQVHQYFHLEQINEFASKIEQYQSYVDDYDKDSFLWKDRINFSGFGLKEKASIRSTVESIPAVIDEIRNKSKKLVGSEITLKEFQHIVEKQDKLHQLKSVLNTTSYNYLIHILQYKDENTNNLWLSNIQRIINDCFKNGGIESSLDTSELGKLQKVLEQRRKAQKQPSEYLKWLLFSKEKYFLKKVAGANDLSLNRSGVKRLGVLLDNRLNFEHNLSKLKDQNWLLDIPSSRSQMDLNDWFEEQKNAIKAKEILASFTNFKVFFMFKDSGLNAFLQKISEVIELSERVVSKVNEWRDYLSNRQIEFLENKGADEHYLKVFDRAFDELVDFDNMYEEMRPYEKEIIKLLNESDYEINRNTVRELFINSIYLEWLDHIETKYPVLREVSTRRFEQQTDELQQSIEEKWHFSHEILKLKLREKVFSELEYNRLNNRTTYRDLQHQVSKKRQVWPLRKLIQEFANELFDLIPCWLASPESTSALFPMEELFDLVIFDEASQCFVEKGIPAMYRGKQVVIAGDSQQLSPNDLYRVRWEEDEPEDTTLEIDSLLDLAQNHILTIQLNGHYRSKSLDLISFSNKHFYDSKLNMLPDFHYINQAEPGIRYEKVDGVWERQTNAVEAKRVIALLKELFVKEKNKEIGVVTFNAPQQGLIWDLLEEEISNGAIEIPNSFFVKNIENVQGDEKDIIIFSTAYAPTASGKMMMQFGSLNTLNGENRLNVAITRAREKIIVISSIYPDQLKVEDTKNPGPKLLKEYLTYAYKVSQGYFKPEPQHFNNTFRPNWFLTKKIESSTESLFEGIQLKEELPFADLTFKHNGNYVGLMLTDDDKFYNSPSVKDLFAYTPFMMQHKNWPHSVIYSRNYWLRSQDELERINNFIQRKIKQQDQII